MYCQIILFEILYKLEFVNTIHVQYRILLTCNTVYKGLNYVKQKRNVKYIDWTTTINFTDKLTYKYMY